jgi:SpoVK/Ycf46/Vps4 family AAA+-type ATPase
MEENSNRFNIYYFPERIYSRNERGGHNTGYVWYKQNQYKILGVSQEELGREKKSNGDALENLFFPQKVKDLIHDVSLWVKSRDWYKEKNIPWKRGWLLYGPPGTGKTALARAFAEDLDLPIYFFSLAQLSNNDFIKSWQSMQLNIPCIALIEDIDNVFDLRKNISQNTMMLANTYLNNIDEFDETRGIAKMPLTFDTLLNCIDGIDKSDGVFTIITTNDISKIDAAIGVPKILDDGTQTFISSRPGRIDKAIELKHMQMENKIQMAKKILSEFDEKYMEVLNYITQENLETPAQFQEYCAQIALQEYWKINK